jgi:hypothetical protein
LSKKMVFVLLCWAVDCTKQAIVQQFSSELHEHRPIA